MFPLRSYRSWDIFCLGCLCLPEATSQDDELQALTRSPNSFDSSMVLPWFCQVKIIYESIFWTDVRVIFVWTSNNTFFFSFYIDWKVNRQKREKIKTEYFTKRVTHPFLSVTKIILKFCSVISSGNTCKAAVWLHISWSYLQPRTSRSPARKPLKDRERGDSLATSMLGNWWRSAQGGKYFLGK